MPTQSKAEKRKEFKKTSIFPPEAELSHAIRKNDAAMAAYLIDLDAFEGLKIMGVLYSSFLKGRFNIAKLLTLHQKQLGISFFDQVTWAENQTTLHYTASRRGFWRFCCLWIARKSLHDKRLNTIKDAKGNTILSLLEKEHVEIFEHVQTLATQENVSLRALKKANPLQAAEIYRQLGNRLFTTLSDRPWCRFDCAHYRLIRAKPYYTDGYQFLLNEIKDFYIASASRYVDAQSKSRLAFWQSTSHDEPYASHHAQVLARLDIISAALEASEKITVKEVEDDPGLLMRLLRSESVLEEKSIAATQTFGLRQRSSSTNSDGSNELREVESTEDSDPDDDIRKPLLLGTSRP